MVQLRVKEILRSKGMTLKDFACKIGKSQPYMSNIINGWTGLSMNTLQMLSRELEVPMYALFADYVPRLPILLGDYLLLRKINHTFAVMSRKTTRMENNLLKYCRNYKGEHECPFKNNQECGFWTIEMAWVKSF